MEPIPQVADFRFVSPGAGGSRAARRLAGSARRFRPLPRAGIAVCAVADGGDAGGRASLWRSGTRGLWLAERFRELGLIDVQVDEVGNVFGIRPGYGSRYVALSAHIDTVFPAATPLHIRQQGSRLYGPGVSDNGAGIAAMLAVASVLAQRAHFAWPAIPVHRQRRGRRRRRSARHAPRFRRRRAGATRLPTA